MLLNFQKKSYIATQGKFRFIKETICIKNVSIREKEINLHTEKESNTKKVRKKSFGVFQNRQTVHSTKRTLNPGGIQRCPCGRGQEEPNWRVHIRRERHTVGTNQPRYNFVACSKFQRHLSPSEI